MTNYTLPFVLLLNLSQAALGSDWPQFRGPNRDDVSRETGLLKSWPEDGPPLVWHIKGLGSGYSTVSIAGDRIYTLGNKDNVSKVFALGRNKGDVVWSAEFAAKGWIIPLTGQYALDTAALLPATVKAASYNGKLVAAPYASDGGMLYYRTDLTPKAPTTWDELISSCAGKTTSGTITGPKPACYAGQFFKYEGLTVNAAEAINAAGGNIVGPDGKTATVESAQSTKGLDFLVNGFKQGYIPKEALGFKETESLNAFAAGQLMYMRNWPYAVAVLNAKGSKVIGKFGIAPLPGPDGHGASSLGGHSSAISSYSKYKATALDFLKFTESDVIQRSNLNVGTLAPVTTALYSDPELVKKFTYLPTLLKSIETAVPRPITPFYPGVTEAIETNAYAALQGQVTTQAALASMQQAIKSATAGG